MRPFLQRKQVLRKNFGYFLSNYPKLQFRKNRLCLENVISNYRVQIHYLIGQGRLLDILFFFRGSRKFAQFDHHYSLRETPFHPSKRGFRGQRPDLGHRALGKAHAPTPRLWELLPWGSYSCSLVESFRRLVRII